MYTYTDKFVESPLVNSYDDTKPRRTHSSLHVHNILNHSSSSSSKPSEGGSEIGRQEKHGKKNNSFACRIREHVKLGPKLSETVKGKLQLGAKIIQGGGRENIFRQVFGIREGEQMLKASQCYFFTTAGPVVGLLFISTEKVVIPVSKIQRASRSENKENTAQKYIEIVTEDNFEYRFMGFLRYEKAFHNLQMAIRSAATRS